MLPTAHPIFPQTTPGTVRQSDFPHLLFPHRQDEVLSAIGETVPERETRLAADRARPALQALAGPGLDTILEVPTDEGTRTAKRTHLLYAVGPGARFNRMSTVPQNAVGEIVYLDDEAPNSDQERGIVFTDPEGDVRTRLAHTGGGPLGGLLWVNALDLLPLPWRYVIERGVWWTDVIPSDLLDADTASLRARVESTRFANEGSSMTLGPGWYTLKHDLGNLARGQRVWLMHGRVPAPLAQIAVLRADSAPLVINVQASALLPVPGDDPSTETLLQGTRERFIGRTDQMTSADVAGAPGTAPESDDDDVSVIIADVSSPADDDAATVNALRARLESVMQRLAQSEERERRANAKIERIVEVAHREANERDWCSEFDDILEGLGLPPREQSWEIEVVYTHRLTVTAAGEDKAREAAWAVIHGVEDLVAGREIEDGVMLVEDFGLVDTEISSVEVA